ncbi:glucan biosynthesis protein, partial [Escherichia coli]|uniref:glucan biosynthesis protein n=1 Tax=Escherichia coli TaxID=562 RepID=UPI00148566B6
MFSCGTNERRMCDTIHPQIHDSERLSMWRGNGEWICRPLNNPEKLQLNAYTHHNTKGVGILPLAVEFSYLTVKNGQFKKKTKERVEKGGEGGKGGRGGGG